MCANPLCGVKFTRELGFVRTGTVEHYCSKSCQDNRKSFDVSQMISGYVNGETMRSLADKYGVSVGTISAKLRKKGVAIREKPRATLPQFRAPYLGYWNEWSNVEKHLLSLVKLSGGVLPGRASFLAAGLDSLHATIIQRWGGIRAVRKKLGLEGLKRCSVCKQTKERTKDFRLKKHSTGGYAYDSICKICSKISVESYRHTWEGRAAELVRRAKDRASQRGFEFDLDQPWVFERLQRFEFRCEISGVPLSRGREGDSGVGFSNRYAASLDRVDSSRGYTKDNVRIVCNRMNTALGDLTDDQFEEFALGFLRTRGFTVLR